MNGHGATATLTFTLELVSDGLDLEATRTAWCYPTVAIDRADETAEPAIELTDVNTHQVTIDITADAELIDYMLGLGDWAYRDGDTYGSMLDLYMLSGTPTEGTVADLMRTLRAMLDDAPGYLADAEAMAADEMEAQGA